MYAHCMQNVRYDQGLIYTNTGPILIAVNPFKTLPLYSTSILEEYYSYGLLKSQVSTFTTSFYSPLLTF